MRWPFSHNHEIEEELRAHIELRADDLERSGLTRADAERQARVEFGGQVRYREESREARGGAFLETVWADIRYSWRALRKSPAFSVIAVLTLALAIGANAVVFGVADALLLRPLNVPHGETLWGTAYGDNTTWQSFPNYEDLRRQNRSFDDLAAFKFAFVGLADGKEPAAAKGFAATGNYFDVLGVKPYLGRFFTQADEHGPNSAPYLVLSYGYWESHFLGDRAVLGRTILLDKHPFTIVGVAPSGFVGTLLFIQPDFFMPIVNQEQVDGEPLLNARASADGIFETFGHLKAGVTPAQAIADLNRVGTMLEKTHPKEVAHGTAHLVRQGLTSFGDGARAFVAALALLAGLILLAACANLGSLFAARAADRSREVAMRMALGSSRSRIVRSLLSEAFLISLAGGMLGLYGSILLLQRLGSWQPMGQPIHVPVIVDVSVYLVALLLAVVSGLLFGAVPVRQVLRTRPYEVLKAGSATRSSRVVTFRELLLGLQIALCAVLIMASLVSVRGLMRSVYGQLGFEPSGTVVADMNLAMAGYPSTTVLATQKSMIQAVETIPGVESAGLVDNYAPLVNLAGHRTSAFKEEATDFRPENANLHPYWYAVSPAYFEAAHTALLAGRRFTWQDDEKSAKVAIINRHCANRLFGSVSNALGRHYKTGDGTRVEVVGVVEDGKYQNLTESQEPAVFMPFLQSPPSTASLIVRSSRDPKQLASAVRRKLHEQDAGLPVNTESWTSQLNVVQFPARMATVSLGLLGILGGLLSVTGIFGMAAHSVSRRMKELGIRTALGAQKKEVLQAALGRAFRLLAAGSAAGLILGFLASSVLDAIVYQATPRDPLVLSAAVLAMLLLGLVATWIPARRALACDPARLLKEE